MQKLRRPVPSCTLLATCLALPQDVIYAEEVSHCAAGVRYLKHLHATALAWPPAAAPAGAEQQDAQQAGRQQQDLQQQQQESEQQDPPQQQESEQQEQEVPAWVREARQHATVELWFHSLVRRHFFGKLKPPFNEEARAAAGFGPEW